MRPETAERVLKWLLVVLGGLAATAVVPMVMPFAWMQSANDSLGLSPLADTPLTQYLTRSSSTNSTHAWPAVVTAAAVAMTPR